MPRRYFPFLSDQYYHLYNRGNNRQTVFFEYSNYLYFLQGIKNYLCHHLDIIAYCLMPTHYHMLVRIKGNHTSDFLENPNTFSSKVSKGMMQLGVSYTKGINKRFNRVGSLFQGQFRSKPIIEYEQLLNMCIYIHANPVKDGLVKLPEDWEFSNYREWMGLRRGKLVDHDFIRENFKTIEEYKICVLDYIQSHCLSDDIRNYLLDLEK
ncbi:MAG: transposase [Anaerolineales bacterium]|nr:transposase [Anaerolineales bacterium]